MIRRKAGADVSHIPMINSRNGSFCRLLSAVARASPTSKLHGLGTSYAAEQSSESLWCRATERWWWLVLGWLLRQCCPWRSLRACWLSEQPSGASQLGLTCIRVLKRGTGIGFRMTSVQWQAELLQAG